MAEWVRSEVEHAAGEAALRRDAALAARPQRRRRRGIVHTPGELARFALRATDETLRRRLARPGGVADPRALIVDPACGPGAFLAAALAVGARRRRPGPAMLAGVDRDAAAVEAARGVLAPVAERRGWSLRLRCADTLASLRPWGRARCPPEATVAIVGNPPWAGRSANARAEPVATLLDDFRRDHRGRRLAERKIGVLSDDYVRFWRWAAEVARRAPGGAVVAFVTNGSFLDGPVHRGMRAALLRWFDGLDVLDLGGSALLAGSGKRDANVFGVRPSVALCIAWRSPGRDETAATAAVRIARLHGSRADKLRALGTGSPEQLGWRPARPVPPQLVFAPPTPARHAPPEAVSLAEAMPFHREGVQTNRDAVATDGDRDRLLERLKGFAAGASRPDLGPALRPSRHYDPQRARRAVCAALEADPDGSGGRLLRSLCYRPFEQRWFVPVAPLCHRPRPELLAAVDRSSFVLLTVRKDRSARAWSHFGACTHVPDNCWLSTRSSCRTRAFPTHRPDGGPNIAPRLAERWSARVGRPIDAQELALYALAVLASGRYRRAFDQALRRDYPRIPPPPDGAGWQRLVDAGRWIAAAFGALPSAPSSPDASRAGRTSALWLGHVALDPPPGPLCAALDAADQALLHVFCGAAWLGPGAD